jgi:hypothetical protein
VCCESTLPCREQRIDSTGAFRLPPANCRALIAMGSKCLQQQREVFIHRLSQFGCAMSRRSLGNHVSIGFQDGADGPFPEAPGLHLRFTVPAEGQATAARFPRCIRPSRRAQSPCQRQIAIRTCSKSPISDLGEMAIAADRLPLATSRGPSRIEAVD